MPYVYPIEPIIDYVMILLISSVMEQELHKKHINIWGVRAYIINGCVTRNNLDDISYRGYFVGYTATMGVILYWKPDQYFVIHIYHHVWFD